MNFLGLFRYAERPAQVMGTERALERIVDKEEVIEAIEAYNIQAERIDHSRSGYSQVNKHDLHILEERRVALVEALKKVEIALEPVADTYDRTADVSVEALVKAYLEAKKSELEANSVVPSVEVPVETDVEAPVSPEADSDDVRRAA